MAQVKYGSFTLDPADLPESSVNALLGRGLAHILGNEVASRVKGWKDIYLEENGEEPNDAEVASIKRDYQQAAVDRIMAGTLGQRQGTPRGTALDTIMRAIAVERLTAALRKMKAKLPVKDETISVGGKSFTRAELIAAHIEKNRDAIESEARRRMEESEADVETADDLV